jgi:hypothetical protein
VNESELSSEPIVLVVEAAVSAGSTEILDSAVSSTTLILLARALASIAFVCIPASLIENVLDSSPCVIVETSSDIAADTVCFDIEIASERALGSSVMLASAEMSASPVELVLRAASSESVVSSVAKCFDSAIL